MQKTTFILLLTILAGCNNSVKKENLNLLNGYWEISKVIFADGNTKTYTASPMVDFFKIEGMEGIRKKVQPKIGGSFNTNKDADKITIREKGGIFTLHYSNNFTEREEQILSLSKDAFSVKDEEQTTYIYLRYKPIELNL